MKRKFKLIILLFALVCLLPSCADKHGNETNATSHGLTQAVRQSDRVYICKGSSSKKYHKTKKCQGLGSCKKTVKKVSVEDAEAMGRTECKKCFKHRTMVR